MITYTSTRPVVILVVGVCCVKQGFDDLFLSACPDGALSARPSDGD